MQNKPVVYCKPQISSREREYLKLGRLELEQYKRESRQDWQIAILGSAAFIGLVFILAAFIQ
jgi:hypothetical protein